MKAFVNALLMILTVMRAAGHLAIGAFLLFLTVHFGMKAFEQGFWVVAAVGLGFYALKWIVSGLSPFTNSSGAPNHSPRGFLRRSGIFGRR